MRTGTARFRHNQGSDETETLQTDVMRFFAIICMCLMVIFALVQAIPLQPQNSRPELETKTSPQEVEDLKEQLAQLIRRAALFESEIQTKKQKLQRGIKELETLAAKIEKLEEREQILQDNLAGMQAEERLQTEAFLTQQGALNELQRKAETGKNQYLIKKQLTEKELRVLQGKIAEAKKQHRVAEARPAPDRKKGFTLGFASNNTLLQMVGQGGQVELFMLAKTKSWKLQVSRGGKLSFIPSAPPQQIYEINQSTVPGSVIRAGRRSVAAFKQGAVTYGVHLSPGIHRQLTELMGKGKGGDITIHADNQITLE
ncbi:hypothetical protein [Desulfotalea psychrophila]|uniref:Uncharacterized protein n=1 Tax=Desulfotalea psychrophila (strain LSv54 / DSM 12343) TaxID=177439 RepID=Q6ANX6_DESPS|nr:hypothetical protein [Desulfotalea psychrophila]CAG35948.1 unknown protein [Desulfotalea psychrophila LSv54]